MSKFPHSDEHKTCPQCGERYLHAFPNYKTRRMVTTCLGCSYRHEEYLGKGIEQWKWQWRDLKSVGLVKLEKKKK